MLVTIRKETLQVTMFPGREAILPLCPLYNLILVRTLVMRPSQLDLKEAQNIYFQEYFGF